MHTHTQIFSTGDIHADSGIINFKIICILLPKALSPLPLYQFSNTLKKKKMLKRFNSYRKIFAGFSFELYDSILPLEPKKPNETKEKTGALHFAGVKNDQMHITKKLTDSQYRCLLI